MTVRKEALVEYFGRKLDDWSWLKGVPEADLYNELVALGAAPYKTRPWKHQLAYLLLMQTLDRLLILLDMGGGKTKIILDDVTAKMQRGLVYKVLVVVPNSLNIDTWCRAAQEHSDLSVWPVDCSNIGEKWERLSGPLGDVTVVDYAGLALAVLDRSKKVKKKLAVDQKRVRALADAYDIVVFDEVHKLKNRSSTWHAIAKSLADRVPYVYGLTGTLFGRDAEEAWAVTSVIDGGETFGTLGLFRSAFFDAKPNPWTGVEYKLNAKKSPVLHTMLQHRSLRYDEHELLELPHREDRVIRLDFPDEQRQRYLSAVEGLVNSEGKFTELDAQWLRMRQITSGYMSWKDAYGEHTVTFKEQPKLDHLVHIVDATVGSTKVVVCYEYTATGQAIVDRLRREGHEPLWIYGGTKNKPATLAKFLRDDGPRVLVMNSAAGGTGTDGLQKVSRCLVFYESPASPLVRKQTLKRVHREGGVGRCFIYDLVFKGSVDTQILKFIKDGNDLHDAVVTGALQNLKKPLADF